MNSGVKLIEVVDARRSLFESSEELLWIGARASVDAKTSGTSRVRGIHEAYFSNGVGQ